MTRARGKDNGFTLWQRVKFRAVGLLGALLIRAIMVTVRVRFEPAEAYEGVNTPIRPAVYALWHGELFALTYAFRGRGARVLISRHRDGEYIARVIERLGFRTVRGSTTRGGAAGMMEMIGELDAGHGVAITPDGPRGPRHVLQQGIVYVAEKSGRAVVPIGVGAKGCWRLSSWDRFMIPKPFTTVVVRQGEDLSIPPDLTEEQREEWRTRLEDIMVKLSKQAEADCR